MKVYAYVTYWLKAGRRDHAENYTEAHIRFEGEAHALCGVKIGTRMAADDEIRMASCARCKAAIGRMAENGTWEQGWPENPALWQTAD